MKYLNNITKNTFTALTLAGFSFKALLTMFFNSIKVKSHMKRENNSVTLTYTIPSKSNKASTARKSKLI